MECNRLPLVTAVGYGKLFKMPAANRFDYFSSGLYQIQSEVNFYPELEWLKKYQRRVIALQPLPSKTTAISE